MTAFSIQIIRLLENLKEIQVQLEVELQKQKKGHLTVIRGNQGETILNQIRIMQQQIESSMIPSIEQRVRGMGKIVIDSWPMDSKLGSLILAAEQTYLTLK